VPGPLKKFLCVAVWIFCIHFIATTSHARGVFDLAQNALTLPVVLDGEGNSYSLSLQFDGQQFTLIDVMAVIDSSDRPASFDAETNILDIPYIEIPGFNSAYSLQLSVSSQDFEVVLDIEPNSVKEVALLSATAGHPTFMSPHASPIVLIGQKLFVANTPADTIDVIDTVSLAVIARVKVGIDPVGIAVRPDGKEVWVANHVSDSVSVLDTDANSLTYLQVIDTIQDFGTFSKATLFDEPIGIAFASDYKAYVALSSQNEIAVINVATREIEKKLLITAQDPRAITVQGNRLFVIPFESNNKTQISGCTENIDGGLCTFDATEHVVDNNNVLSLGVDVDIVKHPSIPDRDLFIFDTITDELIETVDSLGTLLYGVTVDSVGRVFVAQTDARNDANGRAGTLGDGLAEMENRAFLNRITSIDCSNVCGVPEFIDLEPLPPAHPALEMALATPFAIQISDDDSTLVVSAASSNKVFTVDTKSGAVLGRVSTDAVPRGIALQSNSNGQPNRAWVLNAVANTVSVIDLTDRSNPAMSFSITLDDPTHPTVKKGRIAFNNANASTTGTFSCESCHPDGNVDQLVWVLNTPICNREGCTQIPPRTTMPVRGLRDSAPFHWDGIPGDPYGGRNTANIFSDLAPNCDIDEPVSCTLDLVDRTQASTMCQVGSCSHNESGKPGSLSSTERADLAEFLLSVPYPPAQKRAYDNVLSNNAQNGFVLFHITGDDQEDGPNVCGDCHRMPFWVSTNTPGTGMDAPTWRGAYDRWLILPQGRLNIIGFPFYESVTRAGTPELEVWNLSWARRPAFNPVWNMVLEGSTGFSGSFSRQVTLNQRTANKSSTDRLLDALELSANERAVFLQGEGVFIENGTATAATFRFDGLLGGNYLEPDTGNTYSRGQLKHLAANGQFVGTFTARLGVNTDADNPQPALWTLSPIHLQNGNQQFPTLSISSRYGWPNMSITLSGRHIQPGAGIFVDGRRVKGIIDCESKSLPNCSDDRIEIILASIPPEPGVHFLQVQNPDGLISNDFIFFR